MIGKSFCRIILSQSIERNFVYCSKCPSHGLFSKTCRSANFRSVATTRLLATSAFEDDINFNQRLATISFENPNDTDNIVKSPFPDVEVPNVPFSSFIWDDNAAFRGDKIALVSSLITMK